MQRHRITNREFFRTVNFLLFLLAFLQSASTFAKAANLLEYPATGFWNGFLAQSNVLECGNFGPDSLRFELQLLDQFGQTVSTRTINFPGLGTSHVILNDLAELRDRYGTYRLLPSGAGDSRQLRCATAVYRFSAGTKRVVDYAYMLPLRNFLTGDTYGLYNSMNPGGETQPVFNWLSVYNPGTEAQSYRLSLFDLGGQTRGEQTFSIGAGERRDFPLGHDSALNQGQNVGLYRLRPDNSNAPYGAFLMRYGSRDNNFQFAFPFFPEHGSSFERTAFAATVNNAYHWAEFANVGDESCDVRIRVRDRAGTELSSIVKSILPHGQFHYFLNSVLGNSGLGTLEAEPLCAHGQLLLQNLYYGFTSQGKLGWAYAAQDEFLRAEKGTRLGFLTNTFLGMADWLKVRNLDNTSKFSRVLSYRGDGSKAREERLSLVKFQATDIPLHEALGSNEVGLSYLSAPDQAAGAQSELLRVFLSASGAVDTVMYVPPLAVPEPVADIQLVPVVGGLGSPVAFTQVGDGSERFFVSEREGRVRVVKNGILLPTPFLDISSKVSTEGEMGLLSVAFHPQFAQNKKFYLVYNEANYDTVLSEFEVSSGNPDLADLMSEREMLRVPQPHFFHKGGQLAFGPDGYLYFSLGDGGLDGDATGNAQNLGVLLGKILRLDVSTFPYAIPSDNPFVGRAGARAEIWAYGFRNPWRFSFDRLSGELYAGDVGVNSFEEVDKVEAGKNYGWNTLEGSSCFQAASCDRSGTVLPIAEYTHSEGLAIAGGFIYRGSRIPALQGRYVFADYVSGKIWALSKTERGYWERSQLAESGFYISSLGEGVDGELYVVNFFGEVYKIEQK